MLAANSMCNVSVICFPKMDEGKFEQVRSYVLNFQPAYFS